MTNPGQGMHRHDVHVWSVALDQPAARLNLLSRMLSTDELERADRYHFKRDRDRFVAGRATLRAILASYLGLEPTAVAFSYGPQGKPAVQLQHSGELRLGFNLAHSEDFALVALTPGRPVGVDVELVRPFEDFENVPARILSPRDLADFQHLPAAQRAQAFFNAWTRKEAFVKATGLGFSTDVTTVEVTFAPGRPARLVSLAGNAHPAAAWTLRELVTRPGYAAALAVQGPIATILRLEWEHATSPGAGGPDGHPAI